MKIFSRRIFSFILTLIMFISLVSTQSFALDVTDMTDYSEEHWASDALAWSVKYGIIKGYEDGTIRPDDYLTRAEMATVINRAFGAEILAANADFSDVDINDWFYQEVGKAVNMGTFEGDDEGRFLPNDFIRREEAFAVIARALVLEGKNADGLDAFGDYEDVSAWAEKLVAELARNKYINGSPVSGQEKNNLYPRNNITRAEFAQLLHNIFVEIIDYTPIKGTKYDGNILVNYNSGDVVISGITVDGDLVIADGVGLDKVTLKDVTVKGRLVIRGGKKYSLTNVTVDGGVVVRNNNATVSFDNYKSDKVFDGIILKTQATFKQTTSGYVSAGPSLNLADYKVEWYRQKPDGTYPVKGNLADTAYIETETYRATVGYLVADIASSRYSTADIKKQYSEKLYTNYKFDANNPNNVLEGVIASDTTLVLKIYYTLSAEISFSGAGTIAAITDKCYGDKVDLPVPAKQGYEFKGWFLDAAFANQVKDTDNDGKITIGTELVVSDYSNIVLYAKWQGKYKVVVHNQNVENNDYTAGTPQEFDAIVGEQITVDATTYTGTGFVFEKCEDKEGNADSLTQTMSLDKDTEFHLYFNRFKSDIVFDYQGGKDANENTSLTLDDVKYGTTYSGITYPTVTRTNYHFMGWYTQPEGNGTRVDVDTFVYENATENSVTYYAYWVLKGNGAYKITVYKQNTDDDNYTPDGTYTDEKVGDTSVTVDPADYLDTGFVFVKCTDKNQTADAYTQTVVEGEMIEFNLYYNRQVFEVTFRMPDSIDDTVVEVRYDGTIDTTDYVTYQDGYYAQYLGNSYARKDDSGNIINPLGYNDISKNIWRNVANNSWVEMTNYDAYMNGTDNDPVYSADVADTLTVQRDIFLFPKWKTITVKVEGINVSGITDQGLSVYYNKNERAINTIKDFMMLKQQSVLLAVDQFDDRLFDRIDFIIDENNRYIKYFEIHVDSVEALGGEEEVVEVIEQALTSQQVSNPAIVEVVEQLATTGEINIDSEDDFKVMEQFKDKLANLTYDEVKDKIPDAFKEIMSEESIKETFENAQSLVLDNIQNALAAYEAIYGPISRRMTSSTVVYTDFVVKIDLINELLVPKFNAAKDKFVNKYESRFGAMDAEMERVIELISPESLLKKLTAGTYDDEVYCGWQLRTNEDYYDIIKELAVLGDSIGVGLKSRVADQAELDDIADEFASFVSDYLTSINSYLDKYVDRVVEAGYEQLGRDSISFVEKYKDKRLTQEHIDKIKTYAKKVVNGYNDTTDEIFELAIEAADKANSYDAVDNRTDIVTTENSISVTARGKTIRVLRGEEIID
ncbi:MAG: S-layer homology domain-containing protein [Clostridia bacterium]|nr:S-layer homology domain-containing protein [Clostridia bacterium]